MDFPSGWGGFEKRDAAALTGLSAERIHTLTRADNREPIVPASVRRGERSRVRSRSSFEDLVCLCLADVMLHIGMTPMLVRQNVRILRDRGLAKFKAEPDAALVWIPRNKNTTTPFVFAFVTTIEAVNAELGDSSVDGGIVIDLRSLVRDLIAAVERYQKGESNVSIGVRALNWQHDANGELKATPITR